MRVWIPLTLALAVAIPLQAQAQVYSTMPPTNQPTVQPVAVPNPTNAYPITATGFPAQGELVGYQPAAYGAPRMAILRYNWQGIPVMGYYDVSHGHWTSMGRSVNWRDSQPGTIVTVPSNARLIRMTFGGQGGVGMITAMDANTFTVQLPDGSTRTLNYSPNAMFWRGGKQMPLTDLRGRTVYFEIPPGGNQVALFQDVGGGHLGTVTSVGPDYITVRYREGGSDRRRTYSARSETVFLYSGAPISPGALATNLHPGDTVWIYGSPKRPQFVASAFTTGFEAAMGPCPVPGTSTAVITPTPTTVIVPAPVPVAVVPAPAPTTVIVPAPAPVAVETTPAPAEVAVAPAPETTTMAPETTTVETPVATGPTYAAPFSQGTLTAYQPATATSPALATMNFNYNGQPMTGTFAVNQQANWMYQGQPANFSQIPVGSTIMVPANAQLTRATFSGPMGFGTVSSVDRVNNTITVRLPNGDLRTLRYSPQAMVISNGQLVALSSLNPGDTISFEVAPGTNQVAIFTEVPAAMPATITQVTSNTITVQYMQNGQMVTQTIPVASQTMFVSGGQVVATQDITTALQPGQTVFIYGPATQPQYVASNVTTGYEVAVIQPAPTVVTPTTGVLGTREQPRRIIRGRW